MSISDEVEVAGRFLLVLVVCCSWGVLLGCMVGGVVFEMGRAERIDGEDCGLGW